MLFSPGKTETLCVEGMKCAHCKKSVENAAVGVKGVKKAEAELSGGVLTVTIDKDAPEAVLDEVVAAVNACGFKAHR